MGFKIKNSLTGEFEKLPILTLKGEKGETGGVEEYNKVDYMGNKYETLKQANDANVEYAVKTAIGEFNYLDYDGQHITATDSIEGRSKSAILKGQTLVNVKPKTSLSKWGTSSYDSDSGICTLNGSNSGIRFNIDLLKTSTKYLVIFDIVELPTFAVESDAPIKLTLGHNSYNYLNINRNELKVGTLRKIVTTNNEFTEHMCIGNRGEFSTPIKLRFNIIEYQEGMENWDIPYFEGMQSVQMPVLTTTGKNLFDGMLEQGYIGDNTGEANTGKEGVHSPNYMRVKPNTTYIRTISGSYPSGATGRVYFYDINKTYLRTYKNSATFITPENAQYMRFRYYVGSEGITPNDFSESNIQIEEGSTATPYEPYKSNILTTPEDLELRGIGNVKDELNVATGELTQRIGEIVLDGSQSRDPNYNGVFDRVYRIGILHSEGEETALGTQTISCCDKLVSVFDWNGDYEHCYVGKSAIILFINKEKIGEFNDENIKKYLQQNPISVQYQLATESVKTVDLSDNHVYSYKDVTHYDCSSAEGSLVPTLSVKVPTDVQATIAQQRETIQTLNSENERLNQIQEALKASMLDSQVQLMNLSWNTDFEVFALRESIAPKDFLFDSRTGSNIDKFSQAKFIIENDCPDLEKLNSQIEYYFSKDVFSQEQFEELTDLISIVKGENGCEY